MLGFGHVLWGWPVGVQVELGRQSVEVVVGHEVSDLLGLLLGRGSLLPLGVPLPGGVDLGLGDVGIPVVGPHGVWPELGRRSVLGGLVGDVGDGPALVVGSDLHGLPVHEVVDGEFLLLLELADPHVVEDPRGADLEDILGLLDALRLLLVVGEQAALVDGLLADAALGQWQMVEYGLGAGGSPVLVKHIRFRALRVLQWVVVGGQASLPDDAVRVFLGYRGTSTSGR